MAEILSQQKVEDGFEVRVRLMDGRLKVWHFLAQPDDVQRAVDDAEVRLKCGEIEEWQHGDQD